MSNLQTPYGFRHVGYLGGFAPNFANSQRLIAAANTTPIFFGDPVVTLPSGYITKATPGTTQVHGIFIGCEYLSIARGYKWRGNFFPGNDAAADVTAFVINQPEAEFQVQTGSTGASAPATQAAIGANINFATGVGNTRIGVSTAFADVSTIGTTATLPFRVVRLISDPPTVNGADLTTPFNDIIVAFNNQDFKSLTGI